MKKLHAGKAMQIKMVAKWFIFFIFYAFTQTALATQAISQTAVNLKLSNTEIKNVIKSIEKQTDYRFFYTEGLSDMNQKVSVNAENESVEQVLNEVLSSTKLGYRVNNNKTIVIAPKETLQQQGKVSGIVTDENGEPLAGVSVTIKGTSTGVATDIDGRYTLNLQNTDPILVFSYLGYASTEVRVGTQTTIDIRMKEDAQLLDEVVVVGYGTQKKANLTGSVSTINSEKVESRPVPNLSTSLSGLAAGVTVRQSSGNPGSDGASIRIRGAGTFNNDYRGPMVIIDGAQGSMDSVNPDDVESISVLKDAASAAIYGSRAANGVILITTKRGKTEAMPRITYTGIVSSEEPAGKYNFITDYADYMEMFNRAQRNVNFAERYSQGTIDSWRAAAKNPGSTDNEWGIPNSLAYPNTDWFDALFQNQLYQKHNLSVTGGSKNSNYLLSLMYMDNPGTMENTGLKRYQFRINAETKVSGFLKLGTQTYAMRQDKQPGNENGAFTYLFQTVPGMTPVHNGKFGYPEAAEEDGTANNLLWFLHNTGGMKNTTRINTTWYAGADIYKGLTADLRFNYQDYRYENNSYSQSNDMYSFRTDKIMRYGTTLKDATVGYDSDHSFEYTAQAMLNYMRDFGDHSISALFGYEQYYYDMNELNVQSKGLMDFSITDIGTATEMVRIWGGLDPNDSSKQKDTGGEYDYGMISWLGRLNYAYKSKYLFEANFRRDASSRFSPDNRWGTFPSFSGAWRISEESFMQNSSIDNLKLRASWGKLGNTTGGYYDWQAAYVKQNTSMGGLIYNGLAQSKLANPLLSWENVTATGIGLDASFLKQRLNIELDYYDRLTEGIITSPSIYLTMGTVGAPSKNTSDMRNQGVEVSIGWNDKIQDFRYSVSANFSYNQNKIVSYLGKVQEGFVDENGKQVYKSNIGETASIDGTKIRTEGHMIDEFYIRTRYAGDGTYKNTDGSVNPQGGPKDGMIRTPEDMQWIKDMQAAGYTFGINTVNKTGLWYGETIMADLNGDKIYGNSYDRKFTGKSELPKYSYGLTASAAWKGFDFSMQWAGNAGMYYYVNERGISNSNIGDRTVIDSVAASKYYYYNESDPNDPLNNINAKYPRLRYNSNGAHIDNDFYLYNASYIKLKSLQIGYTFSKQWMDKIRVNNLRLFLSGENLATITGFPGIDPEAGAGINIYPAAKQYSVGLNLTF